jgi:hypothetical protein
MLPLTPTPGFKRKAVSSSANSSAVASLESRRLSNNHILSSFIIYTNNLPDKNADRKVPKEKKYFFVFGEDTDQDGDQAWK